MLSEADQAGNWECVQACRDVRSRKVKARQGTFLSVALLRHEATQSALKRQRNARIPAFKGSENQKHTEMLREILK